MNDRTCMKKGYIYKVMDALNNPHRIVLMEDDTSAKKTIKGVGLTHNSKGGAYIKNMPLKKEYFETDDEQGHKYSFQWHDLGNGRVTSMMKSGFDKPIELIIEPPIGKVKAEYMHIIEENVVEYIDCPKAVKFYHP